MKIGEAVAAMLPDGRLHLQHGPIDLVIGVYGRDSKEETSALQQAQDRFATVLDGLVGELTRLRQPVGDTFPLFRDPVAQRMAQAVWPHRDIFITPMAAVAGAVADEILQALLAGRALLRSYVNNGGDIALHVARGERLRLGLADEGDTRLAGYAEVDDSVPSRGIATSGWRGRSFSFGIADSVTVLAENGAQADAAATLIGNAVNLEDPAITRAPANSIYAESDLGKRLITTAVGPLPRRRVEVALDQGVACARRMCDRNLIHAALLRLQGQVRQIGSLHADATIQQTAIALNR